MNKIFIKGRLTKDVELKTTTNGTTVANISVAVNREFKNANGEYETDFFNCTAFSKTAEFLEKYFSKGQEIIIIGRLQNRSWETESGEKRYATDIMIENVDFCGSKTNNTTVEFPTEIKVIENNSDSDLPF